MSDTPRTDEAEVYYSEIVTGRDRGLYWVKADFARELEREMERLRAGWIESDKIALAARIKDAAMQEPQSHIAKEE